MRRSPSFGESRPPHVPFEQWLYRFIEGVGTNVVIEFIDPEKTGEFRMTTDPSRKTRCWCDPRCTPTPRSRRDGTADDARRGTDFGSTLCLWRPQGHGVHACGPQRRWIQVYEDPVQGPAPIYTKIVALPRTRSDGAVAKGIYRLEIVV